MYEKINKQSRLMRVKCRLDRELPARRKQVPDGGTFPELSAVHRPHPAASEKIIGVDYLRL